MGSKIKENCTSIYRPKKIRCKVLYLKKLSMLDPQGSSWPLGTYFGVTLIAIKPLLFFCIFYPSQPHQGKSFCTLFKSRGLGTIEIVGEIWGCHENAPFERSPHMILQVLSLKVLSPRVL